MNLASRQRTRPLSRQALAGLSPTWAAPTRTRQRAHHPPQQPVLLQPGDEVQVGVSAFLVVLALAAAGPPAVRRPIGPMQATWRNEQPVARPAAVGPAGKPGPWTWVGRLMAALGGILLVARAFLPWLPVTVTPTLFGFTLGERTATISGMQGFGPLTLTIGALLLYLVTLVDVSSCWRQVARRRLLVDRGCRYGSHGRWRGHFQTSSQQVAQQLGKALASTCWAC